MTSIAAFTIIEHRHRRKGGEPAPGTQRRRINRRSEEQTGRQDVFFCMRIEEARPFQTEEGLTPFRIKDVTSRHDGRPRRPSTSFHEPGNEAEDPSQALPADGGPEGACGDELSEPLNPASSDRNPMQAIVSRGGSCSSQLKRQRARVIGLIVNRYEAIPCDFLLRRQNYLKKLMARQRC
jgi:hypothetical protein